MMQPCLIYLHGISLCPSRHSLQHNDSLPIGDGFSHRAITMATAPSAFGPYTLASAPIFEPPGYGAEVGKWVGDEDPCIFKQCAPGSSSECAWHIREKTRRSNTSRPLV